MNESELDRRSQRAEMRRRARTDLCGGISNGRPYRDSDHITSGLPIIRPEFTTSRLNTGCEFRKSFQGRLGGRHAETAVVFGSRNFNGQAMSPQFYRTDPSDLGTANGREIIFE